MIPSKIKKNISSNTMVSVYNFTEEFVKKGRKNMELCCWVEDHCVKNIMDRWKPMKEILWILTFHGKNLSTSTIIILKLVSKVFIMHLLSHVVSLMCLRSITITTCIHLEKNWEGRRWCKKNLRLLLNERK